ncbi:MAG: PKD domain-containing protein [Proteobacteria bacterium]|nr:PKD domain-containing protein [Pseudomonadota bacterium]MBU1061032.1 PKD domain-containing protein [Pseudomonadota bacterium]
MKRYLLFPVLMLVLLTTFISSGALDRSSWAGHETELPAFSSPKERTLAILPSIFILFAGSGEPELITAIADASPTKGTIPLTVQFITDSSGPVETWRWDFNGDSTWDWEGQIRENPSYAFTSPGTYNAILQVEDTEGNVADDQVVISVTAPVDPPVVTFQTDPEHLFNGQSATLSWSVIGADTININQGIGTIDASGSRLVTPDVTTKYILSANSLGGTTTAEVEVRVVDPEVDDFVIYINDPTDGQLVSGETITVSGIVNLVTARVWVNSVEAVVTGQTFSADLSLVPGYNAIQATASNNNHTVSDSSWVVRDYTYTPQPEGSFGVQYEDLMPDDSVIASYDKDRFSVISGLVENEQSSSLQGVTITIKNHPEYGTAHTDSTGHFSIPVEGGTTHIVMYQHDSYLTSHRKIDVPINDIAIVDMVRLVVQDSAVTNISFDGNPDTVVTHISSETTDTFGSRAMTMVFQGDNRAWEVDEQGQRIRELSIMATRATEFTTPEAMPSVLPPNSAFTYCAELSVDGVKRVQFEKPVVTYIDNFIGFDVGMAVPVGYYDRDKGDWVSSDNGIVVLLLDTNSDGVVDALDADGDGLADDLNSNGTFEDEVTGLENPARYVPGKTFWRVEITHFTPWDCNWPYGPPEDAIIPNPEDDPKVDKRKRKPDADCDEDFASSIEARSRVYRDDIPVPGTNLQLHYTSSRVSGYKTVINIPVSGASVPASLKRISLRIRVAGHSFSYTLPALPYQKYTFVWDGLDYRGDEVRGPWMVSAEIGFVYDAVYYAPGDFSRAFGQAGSDTTAIEGRKEVVIWRRWHDIVHLEVSPNGALAEGWTLSSHHTTSDPTTLLKGDGDIMQNSGNIIDTIAGNGSQGFSGDSGPAINASFDHMEGVTIDAEGNIFLVDKSNYRIRKIDEDGIISTIIGNGVRAYSGDGGLAVNARIGFASHITTDRKGNIYFNDYYYNVVRKIDTNGIVTTIAGNGTSGFSGDNGSATDAQLNAPRSLAIDTGGNVYISDINNRRLRKVDSNGIITTIAAASDYGLIGYGLAVDSEGNIYSTSANGIYIKKIDTSGIITTIAGNGNQGFSGDGGPATSAEINPYAIAVDTIGNIYFSNDDYSGTGTSRIRVIDTNGIISSFAGTGIGFGGDGGPATKALFGFIYSVVIDAEGNLLVSDTLNNSISRLRKITVKETDYKNVGDIFFPDGNGLGYRFTAGGQHLETMDLDTGVTLQTFGYDTEERLASITDQFGNATTIQYDSGGHPVSITSPDGLLTGLNLDANNHLTGISYPDGGNYSFTYDANGLLQTKTEPAGNGYSYAFDANGRLGTASDEEGGQWDYTRTSAASGVVTTLMTSAENNITTYTDRSLASGGSESTISYPSGNASTITWSTDGLTQTSDLSCGMSQTIHYTTDSLYKSLYAEQIESITPAGLIKNTTVSRIYQDTNSDNVADLITSELSTNGKTTTETHNTLLAQELTTSPEGRVITISYDPVSLFPTQKSMSGLLDETYAHDSLGRVTSLSQGARTASVTYDNNGFMESLIMPGGQTTTYSHDSVGRVTGVNQADNNHTGFSYDANGNLSTVTTAKGVTHSFTTNKVNKTAGYTLPDAGGSYSFMYDNDRRVTNITFPSGGQFTHSYTDNRLTSSQTSDGVAVTFDYLSGNKIQTATRGGESVDYTYDGSLLLNTAFAGTLDQSLAMLYDNDHLLTSLNYAGGSQSYSYDLDGLLTSAGTTTISRNSANGLPEQVSDGVLILDRLFNTYGELDVESSKVNTIAVAGWTVVTRDLNGRITAKDETINNVPHTFTYSYDDLGRLLTVSRDSSQIEGYQYDANGNRITDYGGVTYVYDSQDRLLSRGSITYSTDADGFLQSKTEESNVTTYDYSLRGELLEVVLPDNRKIQYTYDPFGRRIAKSIDDVIVEKYLWAGNTTLLAVFDGSDNLLIRFEYAGSRTPISMTKGGVLYYLIYDSTGSLRLITAVDGSPVKSLEYASFGQITSDTDPDFSVPLGFAGGLFDKDTGLLHFGARDYDSLIGRWIAKDPILFAGGDSNVYAYVNNDPINFVDPFGFAKFPIDAGIKPSDAFSPVNALMTMMKNIVFGTNNTVSKVMNNTLQQAKKESLKAKRHRDVCEEKLRLKEKYRERLREIEKERLRINDQIDKQHQQGEWLSNLWGLLGAGLSGSVDELAGNGLAGLSSLPGQLESVINEVFDATSQATGEN